MNALTEQKGAGIKTVAASQAASKPFKRRVLENTEIERSDTFQPLNIKGGENRVLLKPFSTQMEVRCLLGNATLDFIRGNVFFFSPFIF